MVTGKRIETPPAAPIREFARLSWRAIAKVETIRFNTRPYIGLAERFVFMCGCDKWHDTTNEDIQRTRDYCNEDARDTVEAALQFNIGIIRDILLGDRAQYGVMEGELKRAETCPPDLPSELRTGHRLGMQPALQRGCSRRCHSRYGALSLPLHLVLPLRPSSSSSLISGTRSRDDYAEDLLRGRSAVSQDASRVGKSYHHTSAGEKVLRRPWVPTASYDGWRYDDAFCELFPLETITIDGH